MRDRRLALGEPPRDGPSHPRVRNQLDGTGSRLAGWRRRSQPQAPAVRHPPSSRAPPPSRRAGLDVATHDAAVRPGAADRGRSSPCSSRRRRTSGLTNRLAGDRSAAVGGACVSAGAPASGAATASCGRSYTGRHPPREQRTRDRGRRSRGRRLSGRGRRGVTRGIVVDRLARLADHRDRRTDLDATPLVDEQLQRPCPRSRPRTRRPPSRSRSRRAARRRRRSSPEPRPSQVWIAASVTPASTSGIRTMVAISDRPALRARARVRRRPLRCGRSRRARAPWRCSGLASPPVTRSTGWSSQSKKRRWISSASHPP